MTSFGSSLLRFGPILIWVDASHEQRSEATRPRSCRVAPVRSALVSILLAGFVTPSVAQDLPRYESRIEVRIFNVDVVVEDGDGRPVADLTRSDFELLVDRKPASISNFARIAQGRLESMAGAESSIPTDSNRGPASAAQAEPVSWAVFVDQREFRPASTSALREMTGACSVSRAESFRSSWLPERMKVRSASRSRIRSRCRYSGGDHASRWSCVTRLPRRGPS